MERSLRVWPSYETPREKGSRQASRWPARTSNERAGRISHALRPPSGSTQHVAMLLPRGCATVEGVAVRPPRVSLAESRLRSQSGDELESEGDRPRGPWATDGPRRHVTASGEKTGKYEG